jgi:hypothetical protein
MYVKVTRGQGEIQRDWWDRYKKIPLFFPFQRVGGDTVNEFVKVKKRSEKKVKI